MNIPLPPQKYNTFFDSCCQIYLTWKSTYLQPEWHRMKSLSEY